MKIYQLKFISTLFLCFTLLFVYAKAPVNLQQNKNVLNKQLMDCAPATAITSIEVNNVRALLSTSGTIFFNDETTEGGYEIPNGEGKYSIFAGALWIGALDDENNLKMAAQTYRLQPAQGGGAIQVDDFWPGPLDANGETQAETCDKYDKIWKVTKEEIDAFFKDFADGTIDSTLTENFSLWAGPFVDANGNNEYNPMDGDYPKINGDLSTYSVINDKGNGHTSTPGSLPLGIEIETMAYGFEDSALANITFIDYLITNKSSGNLKKAYLGTWLDPDLGNYDDDFVGCDTLRNLGICYNGDPDDEDTDENSEGVFETLGYGENPPFIGIQILNGIQTNSGKKLGMSGFVYYNRSGDITQGDPNTAQEHYNYLIGKWKDGTAITFGGTGLNEGSEEEVTHMFPSNPSDTQGWSECAENNTPADRRFVMSTGPFDMQSGASKKMTQSVLWVRPEGAFADGCPSFKGIQDLADEVLQFYEENLAGDDQAPEITIDGDDFFNIELGADWTPPTATAIDNVDGEVEVIIDDSSLNLDANGAYDITYTATDSNGNSSERTVTVVVGTGVGINEYALNEISLYPNPVIDLAYLNLNDHMVDLIQIFDVQGQLVFEENLKAASTHPINLSDIESGVYLSKLSNNNQLISLNKFVKQ